MKNYYKQSDLGVLSVLSLIASGIISFIAWDNLSAWPWSLIPRQNPFTIIPFFYFLFLIIFWCLFGLVRYIKKTKSNLTSITTEKKQWWPVIVFIVCTILVAISSVIYGLHMIAIIFASTMG